MGCEEASRDPTTGGGQKNVVRGCSPRRARIGCLPPGKSGRVHFRASIFDSRQPRAVTPGTRSDAGDSFAGSRFHSRAFVPLETGTALLNRARDPLCHHGGCRRFFMRGLEELIVLLLESKTVKGREKGGECSGAHRPSRVLEGSRTRCLSGMTNASQRPVAGRRRAIR